MPRKGYKQTKNHIKKASDARKIFTKEEEQQICGNYFSEEKPSIYTLAKKWDCEPSTIVHIIKRNEYKLRTISEAIKGHKAWNKIFTKEQEIEICNDYFSKEKPSAKILAKKWSCDPTVINNILRRNEYNLRTNSESHKGKNKIFTKEEELQICNDYFSEEKPSNYVLAKKYNCGEGTIRSILIRNSFSLRKKNSPELIQQSLKNGCGINCYYKNEFFPSLQERDCYIKLKKLGFKIDHNFLNRFDFLVNGKIVVEFHPFDFDLTDKQYYNQRRKLLNEYGHRNLKLVIIKDLKEIENKLK